MLSKFRTTIVALFCLFAFSESLFADDIDFEKDILPIFKESCIDCHGPDEQESSFRVDSRVGLLKGGDWGEPGIVPGDLTKGLLISAIGYEDSNLEMPPDEKLSDEKIKLIRRWVKEGAKWPGQMEEKVVREKSDHWSFQTVTRPDVPEVATDQPIRNEIDSFLQQKLKATGIAASEQADARTLIRRASIVLTGLPPTPEQVHEFKKAYAKDADKAYAAMVDRLLDSSHFGERWAQHWLDVIRWAETNGSESNMYRKNAWIYRDYVIRSFNEDKPYDRFVTEQIAGDSLGNGEATGFLVAGPRLDAWHDSRLCALSQSQIRSNLDQGLLFFNSSVPGR